MKSRILALLVAWSFSAHAPTQAAILTWNNGAATGNWNTTDLNFTGVAWTDANDAVFGDTGVGNITVQGGGVAPTTTTFSNTTGTYVLSGGSITSGTVAINGSGGTVTLSAANTYSGNTTLGTGATLNVNHANALGTGALVLGGNGTLNNSTAGAIVTTNALNLSGGSLTFTGTSALTMGNATMTGANRTFTINASTFTVGDIGDAGQNRALIKTGIGAMTMSGTNANTYGGLTTVSRGILNLNKPAGVNAIPGNLTLQNTTANSSNAQVTFLASNQIADTATVTLNAVTTNGISRFEMGNFSETIAALVISNTQASSVFNAINSAFGAGTGTLTVNGPITIGGTSSAATNLGNVKVDLGGGTRTITATGTSPTTIISAIQNGGISKAGSNALSLAGANIYTGPTSVTTGILRAGVNSVAGVSGAFGNNSDVSLDNTAGVALDLTNNAAGNFNTQIGSLTGGGTTGGNITLGSATLTIAGSTSPAAYGGVISGTGALIRSGAGSTILTGANLYGGGTTISGGTLFANSSSGSATGTALVNVTGGTLAGNGIISGATTIASGGTLSPGNSIDSLTINNTLSLAGTTLMEINDVANSADIVDGITTLTFGGTLTVSNLGNTSGYTVGEQFNLFDYVSSSGSFTTINLPSLPGSMVWRDFSGQPFDYTNGLIEVAAIPEPSTWALIGVGLAGICGIRRRSRRQTIHAA